MGHVMVQIEFKYLHRTRNRHGKFYYSFRKKGHKRVRIPGAPGSAEFVAAYESALGMSIDEKKLKPGSMVALVNLSMRAQNSPASTRNPPNEPTDVSSTIFAKNTETSPWHCWKCAMWSQ
jgi:hypothetical protein